MYTVLFFKIKFSVSLKDHHSKDVNLKFQLKRSSRLDVGSNFVYFSCLYISGYLSLIMVTINRQVFINFFQTEHFSAVKFVMGYEKNMSFHVIPKSP